MITRVLCRHPRCLQLVNAQSASLTCQKHRHVKPFCQCDFCKKPRPTARIVLKTREQLRAEGLL